MKALLGSLVLMALMSGCAQPKPPQWYYQDNNDPQTVCGFGSGETASDAKQQAQGDLASRVGVRIGAQFQSNVTVYGDDVTRNRTSDVKSENLLKEMIDVAVSRYSEEKSWWKHLHFMEACISKMDIKTVLERSIEKQMAQLQNKDLYGECLLRSTRQNYLQLIAETSSNVKLLSQYDPQGEYTQTFDQLAQMQAKAKFIQPLVIKSNDAQLTQLLTPLAAKYGIVITDGGQGNGILTIELTGEVLRDSTIGKNQKNYLYVARVLFRLEKGCKTRLYEGSFKSVDQAKSPQSAKLNALNKLAKGVERSTFSTALSQY